jgi:hypothetical protein
LADNLEVSVNFVHVLLIFEECSWNFKLAIVYFIDALLSSCFAN